LKKIKEKTGIWHTGWNGTRVNITSFKGKEIYVVNVYPKRKYFLVQFIYDRKPYEFKSRDTMLF